MINALDIVLKNFDNPDEIRKFDKGKFVLVNLPTMTIGKVVPHDSWVVGRENYISIHFLGADRYADK